MVWRENEPIPGHTALFFHGYFRMYITHMSSGQSTIPCETRWYSSHKPQYSDTPHAIFFCQHDSHTRMVSSQLEHIFSWLHVFLHFPMSHFGQVLLGLLFRSRPSAHFEQSLIWNPFLQQDIIVIFCFSIFYMLMSNAHTCFSPFRHTYTPGVLTSIKNTMWNDMILITQTTIFGYTTCKFLLLTWFTYKNVQSTSWTHCFLTPLVLTTLYVTLLTRLIRYTILVASFDTFWTIAHVKSFR